MKDSAHPFITGWERFWWFMWNVALGAGYFAKIPIKKAAYELADIGQLTTWENFWYVLQNICLGAGYLAKVIAKVALAESKGA